MAMGFAFPWQPESITKTGLIATKQNTETASSESCRREFLFTGWRFRREAEALPLRAVDSWHKFIGKTFLLLFCD
jgi:hypothetical protein